MILTVAGSSLFDRELYMWSPQIIALCVALNCIESEFNILELDTFNA